ncbi:uncharacterized protein LOC129786869 [Lutzomyia longipalpis]|uniref:uncharacterized protein LOC129786869 n=1 Tax=Lutzomyia longipalpis TaxID=7200 RepID=UPI00248346DA|nr:uncharacterized protein LOC129786869 [Lutzomyia longipalpis]XP_055678095.1 uncharacterized protein LOC129786869 [Lutzomyia longipalpis]
MDMTITLCFSLVLLGNSVAHDASATSTIPSTIPSNKVPPLLFPEDDSQYRIIKQNETAIQHILQITSKDDVIREIPLTEGQPTTVEMINTTTKVDEPPTTTAAATTTAKPEVPPMNSQEDEPSHEESEEETEEDDSIYYDDDDTPDTTSNDPKEQVEKIQSDGKYKTSQELEEQFNRNNEEENKKSPEIVDIVVDYPNQMDHTHIVAIVAVVTIAILAFAVYFGLIYWRYHLQKIYGSRQRLVTEDDWYHNDSRDFEI